MSREIKFRAWNGHEMVNVDVLAISACSWSCPDFGTRGVSLAYQPSIKVMQYTGLKDKNGKEIYEGDILHNPKFLIYPTTIKWDNYLSAYLINDGSEFLSIGVDKYDLEVIGNIYENPELLEVNKNDLPG